MLFFSFFFKRLQINGCQWRSVLKDFWMSFQTCLKSWLLIDFSVLIHMFFITDCGSTVISSLNEPLRSPALPKKQRPKSLDLSGGQGLVMLTVPLLGLTKQHHLAVDRLHGVEEEDTETDKQKSVREGKTSIAMGCDPLSKMAVAGKEQQCDTGKGSSPAAEETEMFINNSNSPLNSCSTSMELQNPCSPLFRSSSSAHTSPLSSTLTRSNTHLSLPVRSKERLKSSPSLPMGMCNKDRERPSSLALPSSPSPSTSSFSMDSLLTPTLDIFKSSVISAGKGVAEKASRFYSRLSSQTSLTQVKREFSSDVSGANWVDPSWPNCIMFCFFLAGWKQWSYEHFFLDLSWSRILLTAG